MSTPSWRDVLKIHPACELFPPMSPDNLRVLGEDINRHGLRSPIVLWKASAEGQVYLLDGRNRLDAIEARAGEIKLIPPSHSARLRNWGIETADRKFCRSGAMVELNQLADPYAYVVSANIHRRHLTAEQKRDLIAKLLKADPNISNRQIAETVKADHKTVGAVRAQQEATGEISPVEKRVGKDRKARKQPAKKARSISTPSSNAGKSDKTKATASPPSSPATRDDGGPHGHLFAPLMAQLKTLDLQSGSALVELIRGQDWSRVDAHTKLVALHEINHAVTKLRTRNGMPPIDDGLWGERRNVFQTIRSIFEATPGDAP